MHQRDLAKVEDLDNILVCLLYIMDHAEEVVLRLVLCVWGDEGTGVLQGFYPLVEADLDLREAFIKKK